MERRAIAERPTSPNRDNEDSSSDGSERRLIPVGANTGQISHAVDQSNPEVRVTNLDIARDDSSSEVSCQPAASIQTAQVRSQVQQRNPDIPLPHGGHEDRYAFERVFILVTTIVSCIGAVKQRPSQMTPEPSEMIHEDTILWYSFWGCVLAQLVCGINGFLLLRCNGRKLNWFARVLLGLAFCAAGSALILLVGMELPKDWKFPVIGITGALCFPGCVGHAMWN